MAETRKVMDRRAFVQILGAGAAAFALPTAATESKSIPRPNVMVILPDEWRAQALGCTGNRDVHTPNLDRLAYEGVLFRHTFANSPVCCPARANILTGTYANRNGMIANDLRLRESTVTLGELFSKAGYRTGFIGKWHLDGGRRLPGFVPPGPRRHGFRFWAANECFHGNYFDTQYFRDIDKPIPIKKYEAEAWTDIAIDFLRQMRNPPFFLIISLGPPHDPYHAPEKYLKMYDSQKITMRPNWVKGIKGGGREDIGAYYAAITAIDDQVGRLMGALRELGFEEDTIVLFTSDHGNMLGSHGKVLKRKPWEESIRVPGILRYPRRVKAGRQEDTLLTHVDLAPTLMGLCGFETPAEMQGTNLSRVALGETEKGPDSAFFQILGPFYAGGVLRAWRGVRTHRYMYARWESGPWVLYDLEKDPYELNNLANDPPTVSVRKEMNEKLEEWMRRTGDSWSLNWTVPVEDKGRLYRFETFYTVEEYIEWAKAHPLLAPKD